MKFDLGKVLVACDHICEQGLEEEYLKQNQFNYFPNNLFFEITQKFNLNFFEIPHIEAELIGRLGWPLKMVQTKFKNNGFPHKIVSFILPNGKIHAPPNTPAVSGPNRAEWLLNGKYHRVNGPARVFGFNLYYYINDHLHREDGPAIFKKESSFQLLEIKNYFLFGKFYPNKKEWEIALNDFKKKGKI